MRGRSPRERTMTSTPPTIRIPAYDPGPSGQFAAQVLATAGVRGALIGRLAVWAWLPDSGDHKYTKDVDIAVAPADLPTICACLQRMGIVAHNLPIGGVAVRLPAPDGSQAWAQQVRVDFIARNDEELGDLGSAVAQAVAQAVARDVRAAIGTAQLWVVNAEWLVPLKLVAGREKDDEDVRDLIRSSGLDVDEVRRNLRTHPLLLGQVGRFEQLLIRLGHAKARRRYGGS